MVKKGIAGIVSFAFGGTILFILLDAMLNLYADYFLLPFQVLIGFLLIGLGLWLIIKDETSPKK